MVLECTQKVGTGWLSYPMVLQQPSTSGSPIPIYEVEIPRRPQVILDHYDYIFGGDQDLTRHLLNVQCHMVFRPETRLTHGTLISGKSGTGKSSIGQITAKLIGVNNANLSVDMKEVKGGFQDWMLGKRLVLIHEVKEPSNHGLYNHLKSLFSEDDLHLNIKYGSVSVDNHLHLMLFSNELYPFPFEEGNRKRSGMSIQAWRSVAMTITQSSRCHWP